jgi:hypothetical protein
MAFATQIDQTRYLLRDLRGTWSGSLPAMQQLLFRGLRDMGRQGRLLQKRAVFPTTAGQAWYPLPADHIETFALFQGNYRVAIRLLSQDGHAWWVLVDTTGQHSTTDTPPVGEVLLSATDQYWLQISSPDSTPWYVFPSATGMLLVSDTQPGVGPGTATTVQLRDVNGFPWYPQVGNSGNFTFTETGTATLTGAPIEDVFLHQVRPEAIGHIAPRVTAGVPRRYALQGTRLKLDPVPAAAYQLRHLYFSEDVTVAPPAVTVLPALFAAGLSLQRRLQSVPAAQLKTMYTECLALLAANLEPSNRDGAASFRMPTGSPGTGRGD